MKHERGERPHEHGVVARHDTDRVNAGVGAGDVSSHDLLLLSTTFWCWSATRTLLQFTLLVTVLGAASWLTAEKRPRLSGVLLGLALMKPILTGGAISRSSILCSRLHTEL